MSPPQDDQVQLLDYLIVLAAYSRMIIFSTLAVMVCFYIVLFILPNKYTAIARLLPPQQNLTLSSQVLNSLGAMIPGTPNGGSFGGAPGMAAGLLGLKTPGDLFVGIMNSNTISDHIIKRFDLRQLYKAKYIEDARKALAKNARISLGNKDGLIVIEVTDNDPKRAAEIANAFVEELDKLLHQLTVQEAESRLAFLERERLQANHHLTAAENALRKFSEQNSVIQIDTQTRGMLEYIARLRAEIDAKEVQIQVLRQQATSFNYDMVRLETEIKGLKDKLLIAEKQCDPNGVGGVCFPTSNVPGLGLEYIRLYRESKFQEGLYHLYTKLVELARLDIVRDIAVVQVVDEARPPEKKSNQRLLPTLLAGIATFFTMILVAFGLQYWQNIQKEPAVQRLSLLKNSFKPWFDLPLSIKSVFRPKNKT
jgi:tyrosine-protein kinase Etk/Wzc